MSKKKKAAAAAATVGSVRANPYVQRVVEDDELRENVRLAYESAQSAFQRLSSGGKGLPKSLVEDKKLHKDLQSAADALKDIGTSLTDAPKRQKAKAKKKKGGGLFRKLLFLGLGAGVALAASSDLRNKVLDALFGAEEEFDYTSSTAPSTPAPAPAGTAS